MLKSAVAVIIENEMDQILLVKRGPKTIYEIGLWENAGGEVDCGETLEEAAMRECLEEIGTKVLLLKKLHCDLHRTCGGDWQITIFTGKNLHEPCIIDCEECEELGWFDKQQLCNLPLTTSAKADFQRLGWLSV